MDMSDIQIVQIGQVRKNKNWKGDSSNMETQSMMFGQSQFGQSMTGVSMQPSMMGQSSKVGPNGEKVTFIKTSLQHRQDQVENQKAYMQAKK